MTGATVLAEDPRVQYELGVMESRCRSAERWVRDAFDRCERSVADGGPRDDLAITEVKQATTFLTQEGTRVIERAYNNAGTEALRDGPLQRCFRDIHAGSQHAMVSPAHTYEVANAVLADAADSPLDR